MLLAILALTVSARAEAQEAKPRPWSVDGGLGLLVLGPGERPTGGPMPSIGARYTLQLGDSALAHAGLSGGAFGFGDTAWLGWLVGPEVGAGVSPLKNVSLGASFGLDGGRIPVCNDWGLCLPYWSLVPRGAVSASLDVGEAFAIEASLQARYVSTLGWTGVAWEPRMVGRVSF